MKNERMVFIVWVGRKQHSTWFSADDAMQCLRIFYKRGKSNLRLDFVTI